MNFKYKIRDANGEVVTGFGESTSKATMLKELKEQGFVPLAIVPDRSEAPTQKNVSQKRSKSSATKKEKSAWDINLGGKIVKPEELIVFTRDLHSLVHAGVPLVSGIEDLASQQLKNRNFRAVLEKISEDINAGSKLSEAIERQPHVFSEIYCSSIKAGEHSGRLEVIFERLVATLEHDLETTQMVKTATRYPIIVVVVLMIAFVAIVTVVIPKISGIFDKFGTDLPFPTRALIATGNFAQNYGLLLLLLSIVGVIALHFYKKTEKGSYMWDAFKMGIPILGGLSKKLALSKFASTLQTLYGSGVLLPEAIKACAKTVGNQVVGRALTKTSNDMQGGRSLSEALKENRLYPPMVVRMIMMGEKTGNLEKMLGEVVLHYNRQIEHVTKNLGTMIEPILTLMLGGMILVLALGVFMPMWNVIKLFNH
jgi:MSHA biogenesis protein MshG